MLDNDHTTTTNNTTRQMLAFGCSVHSTFQIHCGGVLRSKSMGKRRFALHQRLRAAAIACICFSLLHGSALSHISAQFTRVRSPIPFAGLQRLACSRLRYSGFVSFSCFVFGDGVRGIREVGTRPGSGDAMRSPDHFPRVSTAEALSTPLLFSLNQRGLAVGRNE